MSADIIVEPQGQDAEIESPLVEAVGNAEYTLEELAGALVDKLFGTLNALNEPLEEERAAKAAEAQTLRASHAQLQPRVEAQRRILDGEIDRAIAEGRDADAEAKREERAELEQNLRDILTQAEACERRVQELEASQRQNYRRVFESNYPELREACVATEIALCKMLDKVWAAIMRYAFESGLDRPFVMTRHKADMTPRERGPEAPYLTSLQRWFGGRR